MRRTILSILGIALLLFGALFLLQGLNVIRWPADSFMLGRQTWVTRGALLAAVGVILLAWAWLSGRRN